MADWGKQVFLGTLLGAAVGVLLGIGFSWLFWRAPEPSVPRPSPYPTVVQQEDAPTPAAVDGTGDERGEALVLLSALYALDGDLERARERLVALGLDDATGVAAEAVAETVADMALLQASMGNEQIATDLATLAAALGYRQGEALAYVATATPTLAPQPTQTPAPTDTPTSWPTYTPTPTAPPPPTQTPSPAPTRPRPTRQPPPTATPPPPVATPLPLVWDRRVDLLSPPIKRLEADVAPGQKYWRLVRLEWWKAHEGGNTLIYVNTLDENGAMVWGQQVIVENGGHTVLYTDPKLGEIYGANFPMSNTLNSYIVFVGGDLPSERVVGLGLGEWYGGFDHTTFVLAFQRGVAGER